MKYFNVVLVSISFFLVYSCSSDFEDNEYLINTELETREVKKHIGEFVCVTSDKKSGKVCKDQLNGDCKKAKKCTSIEAIGNGSLLELFTQDQIENFDTVDVSKNYEYHLIMYEAGWFYHPDSLDREWEN